MKCENIRKDYAFNIGLGISIWGSVALFVGIIYLISQIMSIDAWLLLRSISKWLIGVIIFTIAFLVLNYFTGYGARLLFKRGN